MSPFTKQSSAVEPIDVLFVEDNPHDVTLLRDAFESAVTNRETRLHVVTDGSDAMSFLCRSVESDTDSPPNFVLLDLNLPSYDGTEILETITDNPQLRWLPIVVLTGSDDTYNLVRCYEGDANACLTKPPDLEGFVSLVETIDRFWLTQATLPPTSI
ncbi:response regulator [Haloterrigena salifodinae]|uniref:response regulator n=1 Tax=Haloterrigena salifodinae TaxID=2675099 RepID=UPI000F85CBA9|nr:response regulator [Haloterrigena salifodinae]